MDLSIEPGLLGTLAIQSPFDPDKLKCSLSSPGAPYTPHLVITYDGDPFNEEFDYRNKAWERYLISPDGTELDIRWLDEDM
jgi:hypothetical protein